MATTPMAPDPLLRHLAMSPEPELPPGLWTRIDHARRRRRNRQALGTAVVAVALLAVSLVPRLPMDGAVPGPAVVAVESGNRQPAAGDAGARVTATTVPRHSARDVRLRALDRALQAAYREGSSEAEIAQLWQARRALLDGPPGRSAGGPIRI